MGYSDAVSIARLLVVLAALLIPVASTTLANSDAPSPTWAGGYWDDDDSDYAVDAILRSCAVPPASAVGAAGPWWINVARVALHDVNAVAPEVSTTDAPRGPPARSHALA